MTLVSGLVSAGLLGAMVAVSTPMAAQCSKDVDCKGDRICVKGTCVDPTAHSPSQDTSRPDDRGTIVRSHLERRVGPESNNALALESFAKTNGYDQEMTHLYMLEWQAEIRFVQQGWKPGDAIGGYWNDFQVLPARSGFLTGSWEHFNQGTRVRLRGTAALRRTEQGWRIEEFTVSSYQKLATEGNAPSSSAPRSAPAGPARTLQNLRGDIEAGKDVTLSVKYVSGAVDSSRYASIYGGLYLADGKLRFSKVAFIFEPSVGAPGFTVAPDKILLAEYQPNNADRLHLRVAIANKKGKEKPEDFYLFNPGATAAGDIAGNVGGAGAFISCNGCDQSMSTLYALIGSVQRRAPAGSLPPSGAAENSRLSIAEPIKDFGTVSKDQVLKWTFELKNTGSTDLEILAAKPLCGCTQTSFTKIIKPGTSGNITATVNVSSFKGPISKVVDVVTNDPAVGTQRLTIKAIVTP